MCVGQLHFSSKAILNTPKHNFLRWSLNILTEHNYICLNSLLLRPMRPMGVVVSMKKFNWTDAPATTRLSQ